MSESRDDENRVWPQTDPHLSRQPQGQPGRQPVPPSPKPKGTLLQPLNILLSPPLQPFQCARSLLSLRCSSTEPWIACLAPACRFFKSLPTNLNNDNNYSNNNSVNDAQTLCLVRPSGEEGSVEECREASHLPSHPQNCSWAWQALYIPSHSL